MSKQVSINLENIIRYFDEDGDGKISPSELQRRLAVIGGNEVLPEEAEAAVGALDSDGDGLLGADDLVRLMELTGEDERVEDLKVAFGMYVDLNGPASDVITPKSLKRMLSRLGESKSVGECEIMIGSFDLNGDGVISFEEFRVMME